MAKAKRKAAAPKRKGPFIMAAVIAEKILMEPDNATTIVRIIDKVGLPPEAVKAANLVDGNLFGIPNLVIFVSFRAGGFRGKGRVSIIQASPSGNTEPTGFSDIQFDGSPSGGFNIKAPVVVKWDGEGQYWYDVFLDDTFCSRIPLYVALAKFPDEKKSKK